MNLQLEESYDKNKFTRDQEIAYYQKDDSGRYNGYSRKPRIPTLYQPI